MSDLERFTESEIFRHASLAHEYFVKRPDVQIYQIPMKYARFLDTGPGTLYRREEVLRITRPQALRARGLGEAVKAQAAFWDLFNNILECQAAIMGDR